MPALTTRQLLARNFNSDNHRHTQSAGDDEESTAPDDLPPSANSIHKAKKSRRTLQSQLTEKDARIAELEANIYKLSADLLQVKNVHQKLSVDHQTLLDAKTTLSTTNKCLNILKRKADAVFKEDLAKKHKRIKRLENERETKKASTNWTVASLETALDEKITQISQLGRDLGLATTCIISRDATILALRSSIRDKQSSLVATRNRLYAAQKQAQRAKSSLKVTKKRL
ncbi:hypothetical protein C8R44DRAFT_751170 [Mycena epipterygia]|nr:hypothetical protein C8R44DRAFT_751170 [Mycena epipterygia]